MAKKTIIYDQFGRPYDLSAKKMPERTTMAVAPILDSARDYITNGLTPERLASVFRAADTGDMRAQAELFDQLEEKDGHLLCERDKRKNVILDMEFAVEPAGEDARDQKVAEFVSAVFDGISDFDDVIVAMQDAVGKGFSALELCWDVSSGQAVPDKIDFIEQKRFLFFDDTSLLRKFPRLITDTDMMGMEIPPWKMLLHCYGGKSGHPARSGIYRVAAWMVLFKHYSIKDWVAFSEIFGMPLRLGRYDQGATSDEKSALLAAISSLGSDAAGIISKSTEIEFIETVKNAHGDLYKLLASFCNGEMSKAILGQTLTADVGGSGSYAAAKTHNEVRLDLLRADGRSIATTIRNQLIRPLVGFNFGWDTAVPKYVATYAEPDDLVSKSEWMKNIMDRVAMPLSFVNREFSIPDRQGDEEMVGGVVSQESTATAAKLIVAGELQTTSLDPVDVLVNKTLEETSMEELMLPVRRLLDEVTSLEEFRERLLDIYADMDTTTLAKVLQSAFVLADHAGQFDGRA
jgi:phage gp29-like protein